MKNLFRIVFISLTFIISSSAQDSTSKRLALGWYGGIQIPGYVDDTHLDPGPWFGLSVNIPTGLGWCIQFEYNFWKSIDNSREFDEEFFVSEFPLLVGYKWDFNQYYLQFLTGLGIGSYGSTLFGGERDPIFSFDVTLKFGYLITKDVDGFIQVRKQYSGTPRFGGGGSAYNPWLIGLGLQYRLNK